jgi:hypothetical protein
LQEVLLAPNQWLATHHADQSRETLGCVERSRRRSINVVYALLTAFENASEHKRTDNSRRQSSQNKTAGEDFCNLSLTPRLEMMATTENWAGIEQLLHDFCIVLNLAVPFVEQSKKSNQSGDVELT